VSCQCSRLRSASSAVLSLCFLFSRCCLTLLPFLGVCAWSRWTFSPSPIKGSMPGSPAEALGAAESPRGHSPAILQCGGLAGIGLVLAQTGREICEVDSMISGASAHACGLIHPGDKLLSVNGRDVRSACMQVSLSAFQSRLPSPLPPCFSHASFRASLRLSHPSIRTRIRTLVRMHRACSQSPAHTVKRSIVRPHSHWHTGHLPTSHRADRHAG